MEQKRLNGFLPGRHQRMIVVDPLTSMSDPLRWQGGVQQFQCWRPNEEEFHLKDGDPKSIKVPKQRGCFRVLLIPFVNDFDEQRLPFKFFFVIGLTFC